MPKGRTYKEMETLILRDKAVLKAKQAKRRAKITKRKPRITPGANRIEDAYQRVVKDKWIGG